jgi:preprotein translocase subunit YajC
MRPQQKRKKEQQELKESLAPGCEITTIGGIIGKIVQVTENHVVFETSEDGVRIQVAKWAIANKGMVAEQPQS